MVKTKSGGMRSEEFCPRCGRDVQMVAVDPTEKNKFLGSVADRPRLKFVEHYVSADNRKVCDGSGQLVQN